jgi:predicted glycosyltransferase
LNLLKEENLEASRLANLMTEVLDSGRKPVNVPINLDGARETARWIEHWQKSTFS